MQVALYIRVSTEEQAVEGYSIGAQKERLISFCHSQGWDISEFYIEDGKSAKDLDRPELQRLLNDMKNNLFDIVLVYKLDRLTRSVMDLYSLLQGFEKHNVKFKSATEVYDTTTAMGRLFITLVAALAQWERENLAERVRFGMEQMVHEGKRPGGPIPYGYDTKGNIISEERDVLHELRRLYLDGLGFRSVAMRLNQDGKLKRGIEWSSFTVWYVLDNPYYAGFLRWGGKKTNGKYATRKKEERVDCIIQKGEHEAIFSEEQYQEHISMMKRKQFPGFSKKNEYWFSGILRCGRCGSAMTGRFSKRQHKDGTINTTIFYICSKRQQGQGCNMPMFRQVLVEKLIMEYISKIRLDFEKIDELTEKESSNRELKLAIERLKSEVNKVQERKKKWQYAFVNEAISIEDLRARNAEEDAKEVDINNRIDQIQSQLSASGIPTENSNLLIDLPNMWKYLDDQDKNEMAKTIFNTIELDTPIHTAVGRKGQDFPASIKAIKYN